MSDVIRRPLPWLLILLACSLALGGCGWRRVKLNVPISGPPITRATGPVELDLTNWNGGVKVSVQERFKKAKVYGQVKRTSKQSPRRRSLRDSTTVTAESVVENGKTILRVRSSTSLEDPSLARAFLRIRLPSCDGVTIRNAGGTVELRHVAGPINIENGSGNLPGGRVEVWTEKPMTDPVSITTTNGTVYYQVGPESTGRFELTADGGGQAAFEAKAGKVKFDLSEFDHFLGTLNDGTNPVVLRSQRGTVWARILENAGSYRPPRWPVGPVFSVEPPR